MLSRVVTAPLPPAPLDPMCQAARSVGTWLGGRASPLPNPPTNRMPHQSRYKDSGLRHPHQSQNVESAITVMFGILTGGAKGLSHKWLGIGFGSGSRDVSDPTVASGVHRGVPD